MGKKSRIRANPPRQEHLPKPLLPDKPKRVLAEFREQGPVQLKQLQFPCGPPLHGFKCMASWSIVRDDAEIFSFLGVSEDLGNVRRLFHGTRSRNVASITREGLRRGRAGGMFGAGVYFGPPKKAIHYASSSSWGDNGGHYLFEVEVALGKMLVAEEAHQYTLKELTQRDCHSVHGKAHHTKSWGGVLRQDEFVVYSRDQILLDKLHEYQPTHTKDLSDTFPVSGPCVLITTKNVPLGKRQRAFADILSQKVCGRKGHTKLYLEGHQDVWVCDQCIEQNKLRVGSKVRIQGTSYSGPREYRIRGQGDG